MDRRSVRSITRKEWVTSVAAGSAGAVNGAGLMVLDTPALLGVNSFWELYVTSCLMGALVFPAVTVTMTNHIADGVIMLTSRSNRLRSLIRDLVDEFGLATVTTPLGVGAALILWVTFGVLLTPFLLTAVDRGGALSFPHFGRDLLLGYLVYGLSLGGFYGLIVQEQEVRRRVVRAIRPNTGTDAR